MPHKTNTLAVRPAHHPVDLVISTFLIQRSGRRECEWDQFLISLIRKVQEQILLDENATKRLREQIQKLKEKFMEPNSLLRGDQFLGTGSAWINNGCPVQTADRLVSLFFTQPNA